MNSYDEIFIIAIVIGVIIGLIPLIFYLITLQNTLKKVNPENQKMTPGSVWMILIPGFGIVWHFIVVNRISVSLKLEFEKRNIQVNEVLPGKSIGITFCILASCSIIPFVGVLASVGGLVCWIIYWSKIAGYKNKLID